MVELANLRAPLPLRRLLGAAAQALPAGLVRHLRLRLLGRHEDHADGVDDVDDVDVDDIEKLFGNSINLPVRLLLLCFLFLSILTTNFFGVALSFCSELPYPYQLFLQHPMLF